MSNFKCSKCGMINIDCGKEGYKTPREIELEKRVKELEEKLEALKLENQEGYEIVAELKHECEELKERLVRTEEDLKYQCVDCMNAKSDRYRTALDEIEGYIKEEEWSLLDYVIRDINNIINKAKGEEQ